MNKLDVLKCDKCNAVVEVVVPAANCVVQGFTKLEEKHADASTEKHVPFIVENADGYTVRIGKDAAHPMTEEHSIQFIEILIDDEKLHRVYLKPGHEAVANFKVAKGNKVVAREYCNLHGLWTTK